MTGHTVRIRIVNIPRPAEVAISCVATSCMSLVTGFPEGFVTFPNVNTVVVQGNVGIRQFAVQCVVADTRDAIAVQGRREIVCQVLVGLVLSTDDVIDPVRTFSPCGIRLKGA